MQRTLKTLVESLPESLGRPIAKLPFALRFGPAYTARRREIERIQRLSIDERVACLVGGLGRLLRFAASEVPFYRDFYHSHGYSPLAFRRFEDWKNVPVVTKADLCESSLSSRVAPGYRFIVTNTGGSTGQPLEFGLDANAFAREWAHMHHIWQSRGYHPAHIKLTLRGKHFLDDEPLRYNAVHNEYVGNANYSPEEILAALPSLPRWKAIRWVHGYPSLVAEFAIAVSRCNADHARVLRTNLLGILLGSEYPHVAYRRPIEDFLSSNLVSWYGHSEMAILAKETSVFAYETLPSYGFAEAVASPMLSGCRLVGTSLRNFAHPFIRYDTGDVVEAEECAPDMLRFRVTEGRIGDFVKDRRGTKHSLTAIIFGRHHASFSLLKHVQIRDDGDGQLTVMLTPREPTIPLDRLVGGMDFRGIDADFHWQLVQQPIRTITGKLPLKIPAVASSETMPDTCQDGEGPRP
jgi:phenylacetate-CoA ligase